ncbi:hypothetical protein NDU88_002615 [Pleurodeles waltl]|uniref:Uncharacterized protein n=1 Tax=Pleurodeles waltl TaxID=8319 RepID=A0AAV7UDL8_PLEWA|nr:hypothetical protein NDU88_002615 [Pleurodeles waltl]
MLLRPQATGHSRTPDAPPSSGGNLTWRLLVSRVQARSSRQRRVGHSAAKNEHPPPASSAGPDLLQQGLQAGRESVPGPPTATRGSNPRVCRPQPRTRSLSRPHATRVADASSNMQLRLLVRALLLDGGAGAQWC